MTQLLTMWLSTFLNDAYCYCKTMFKLPQAKVYLKFGVKMLKPRLLTLRFGKYVNGRISWNENWIGKCAWTVNMMDLAELIVCFSLWSVLLYQSVVPLGFVSSLLNQYPMLVGVLSIHFECQARMYRSYMPTYSYLVNVSYLTSTLKKYCYRHFLITNSTFSLNPFFPRIKFTFINLIVSE